MRIGARKNLQGIGTVFSGADRGAQTGRSNKGKSLIKSTDTWSLAGCAGTTIKNSGARYFEVLIERRSSADGISIEVVDASQSMATLNNTYANSGSHINAGYYNDQFMYCYGGNATPASGTRWWDGVDYTGPSVGLIANGDTISIFLDIDNGKIWGGKNGVWGGAAAPAVNGSDYHFIDRIPQTTNGYKIMCGLFYAADRITLRTTRNEFKFAVPATGIAWDE